MRLILLVLSFPVAAFAAVQNLTASGGEVDILAKGKPSFIKIQGKGSAPTGQLELNDQKIKGALEFDLSSLDTGIATRNTHMKEKYLEVGKYPKAVLNLQNLAAAPGWSLQTPKLDDKDFEGTMTMHGVTKPVKGKFSISDKGSVLAQFTVKLTDYQISIPTFAGITVADDVDVTVKIDNLKTQ